MYKSILKVLLKWFVKVHKNAEAGIVNIRHQLYFMDFEERDSDVFVVTYLKSGTTWMQVILHNLLTDGNMDFKHIYDVSPWPKNQSFKNESVEKLNKLPAPRILKSHDDYNFFNKEMKGKIIYVFRDGRDVAVSLYHHNKNYLDPELTFDGNFEEFFTKDKAVMNWFKYNNEWLVNKDNLPVLYVSYEQLKNDFDNTIIKISNYLNIVLTEEIMTRIKKHSSFEYMKVHETKFGEKEPETNKKIYNQFIRSGNIGEGKQELNKEQLKYFENKNKEKIVPYMYKFN